VKQFFANLGGQTQGCAGIAAQGYNGDYASQQEH
jgi:hypothetical protein